MIFFGNLAVVCFSLLLLVVFRRTRSFISLNGAMLLASFFLLIVVKIAFLSDLRSMGFRVDNIKDILFPVIIFCLSGAAFLLSFRLKKRKFKVLRWVVSLFTLYLAFGLAEQIFFQGIFTQSLQGILKNNALVVVLSSVFFSAFHIGLNPYGLKFALLAFIAGVVFSTLYLFSPNLLVLGFSHAVLASLYYFLDSDANLLQKRLSLHG